MLYSINNLAFRTPLLMGLGLFVAGCYTIFSHPESDLLSHEAGNDCESCHSMGFAAETFASPYSYTSTPFFDYYEVPWWIPSYGEHYSGEGDGDPPTTPVRGGRHVMTRSQRPSVPDTNTGDSEEQPASRATAKTKEQTPAPSTPEKSDPQPGRTMKENSDKKSSDPEKKESTGDSPEKTKGDDDPEGRK